MGSRLMLLMLALVALGPIASTWAWAETDGVWTVYANNLIKQDLKLEICANASIPNCVAQTFLNCAPRSLQRISQGYPTKPILLRVVSPATGRKLERKLWPGQLDPFKVIGSVISFVPAPERPYLTEVWFGNDKWGNIRLGTF